MEITDSICIHVCKHIYMYTMR